MDDSTVTATKFKTDCLKLVDEVSRERKTVVVTRHGKPVAKLVPVEPADRPSLIGAMAGTMHYDDDLIAPPLDPSEWEVLR